MESGSGKIGTPWARTHCENRSACAFTCCTWAAFGPLPPFGSRCRQALCAACTRELPAPSCCDVSLDLSNTPLLEGSGQFVTPLERMQRAKATAPFGCADAVKGLEEELLLRVVVELSCATSVPGEPPHAAASRASPAVAMIAVRANGVTLSMIAGPDYSHARRR